MIYSYFQRVDGLCSGFKISDCIILELNQKMTCTLQVTLCDQINHVIKDQVGGDAKPSNPLCDLEKEFLCWEMESSASHSWGSRVRYRTNFVWGLPEVLFSALSQFGVSGLNTRDLSLRIKDAASQSFSNPNQGEIWSLQDARRTS